MNYFTREAKILECVVNVSEGSDLALLQLFYDTFMDVADLKLLHHDSNVDANRTVLSFAGKPGAVVQAAFSLYQLAIKHMDMRTHQGVHPRMGAIDVSPLIPIQHMTMEEAVHWSQILAKKVGALGVPVYLYEFSSSRPRFKNLASIRKGGYEALPEKLKDKAWKPDFGPSQFNPRFGATVIGARDLLIAFNISLDTENVTIAKKIAAEIRSSGSKSNPGFLPHVKAIGWYLPGYRCCQVSMNLTNYKITPPHIVYAWIGILASKYKINILGSELIGLMPEQALVLAGKYAQLSAVGLEKSALVNLGINYLKLDWRGFDSNLHILENVLFN